MIDKFEIEFLPVGTGEKSGDCIVFHYYEDEEEKILVYDGGTKQSGEALVNHVRNYYDKEKIDYLVNSHPDMDHISGLIYIAQNLEVGEIWMHQPWEHSDSEMRALFHDQRMTDSSLSDRLKKSLRMANELTTLAEEKNIPICEPFAGSSVGPFTVLSPNKEWYLNSLLADFSKSPEKSRDVFDSIKSGLENLVESVISFIEETLETENLPDDATTSAENDSSVILYGDFNHEGYLLMGDSGIQAIHEACDFAVANNIQLGEYIKFVQVPHHGSRRNVSTDALNRLLGKPSVFDLNTGHYNRNAFVSASPDSTKHPRDRVVNAFIRRGFKVTATKGNTIRYPHNMPSRLGWSKAPQLEFSHEVEEL